MKSAIIDNLARRSGRGIALVVLLAALVLALSTALALPAGAHAESIVLDEGALTTEAKEPAVNVYEGANRYETARIEAVKAFPKGVSNDTAILVSGDNGKWADALSASSLAGAMDSPILITPGSALHEQTKTALTALSIEKVIIIGGTSSVSSNVANELKQRGIEVSRIYGNDRFETQSKVYRYGKSKGYWTTGTAIVATGSGFADSLSASPLAFAKKVPIVLVKPDGRFGDMQVTDLYDGGMWNFIVVGGTESVPASTADMLGAVRAYNLVKAGRSASYDVTRLSGSNRYQTSAAIASWCVKKGFLTWDKAAFATGASPTDALVGSALQGTNGSVLLLVAGPSSKTIKTIGSHKSEVKTFINIFGGKSSVSAKTRNAIYAALGLTVRELDGTDHPNYYIMGKSSVTAAQMAACYDDYVKSKGWSYPAAVQGKGGAATSLAFCKILLQEANYEGVRAEVLFAQIVHETGWLQYGGLAKPEWYNYGGLGVTGAIEADGTPAGNKFKDVRTGIRAQVQHLKAYASKDALVKACVDERFTKVERGCAPTIQELSGKWAVPGVDASGVTYGDYLYMYIMLVKGNSTTLQL